MSISSIGVGSGLDVNSIVSQLVAIEKQPLQALKTKATTFQSQLSTYGTIKSQASALGDAAGVLSGAAGWNTQKVTSSSAAVTATAAAGASAIAFDVEVTQLARQQTTASRGLTTGSTLGASGETGSLTITLGSWASGTFSAAASGSPVTITGINGDDSLATIATKVNAANAGVTATVLKVGDQEQLVFRSATTGADAGFQIESDSGFAGLDSLSFTSLNTTASTSGMQLGQTALNANVKINGIGVESAANTLTDVVPGITLKLNQVTTAPAEVSVAQDMDLIKTNIQAFVDAYNTLTKTLTSSTKYVTGGASGVLQGDSTAINLQTVLRRMLGSSSTGSTFARLSDIGLEPQTDGTIKVNSSKLDSALKDTTNLQKLFTANNGDATTNGFGLKFKDFTHGLLAADGTISNKSSALESAIKRNTTEQDRVTDRASRVEKQLRRQYSALDVQMAKMSSLSSYVTAQLAQWNKATN